jgi:Transposase DDE domain
MRLCPPPAKPDPVRKLEQLLAQPQFYCIPLTIVPHCQAVPLGVLVRGLLEWLLDDPILNQLFLENAPEQYERELTFAVMVKLLIQVSAGTRRSVFAAFKKDQESDTPSITTSYQALYTKMGRLNPAVSEALVRHSADKLGVLLQDMPPAADEPIPGYRMRVLDGNVLTATDHRLKPLRRWLNACLPGKSLVVYEPRLGLVTDLVLCPDAYTQERALLGDLLPRVGANDLWVADRNFCTTRFVFGVLQRQGFVVVRQHRRNLPCHPLGRTRKCGNTSTGVLYEQRVQVTDSTTGETRILRRIELRLFEKTRDGDRTLAVLTNLPETVSALQIAEVYRQRWTIEKHFQFITESLHCEIPGLGKPRAALLLFAMALVAGNALAVVRGSLRAAHGPEAAAEVSGYYLADEIAGDYRAVMKYLAPDQWQGWRDLSAPRMAQLLTAIAAFVRLGSLTRNQRGPKKPPVQKPVYDKKHKHYSTARLLEEARDSC